MWRCLCGLYAFASPPLDTVLLCSALCTMYVGTCLLHNELLLGFVYGPASPTTPHCCAVAFLPHSLTVQTLSMGRAFSIRYTRQSSLPAYFTALLSFARLTVCSHTLYQFDAVVPPLHRPKRFDLFGLSLTRM